MYIHRYTDTDIYTYRIYDIYIYIYISVYDIYIYIHIVYIGPCIRYRYTDTDIWCTMYIYIGIQTPIHSSEYKPKKNKNFMYALHKIICVCQKPEIFFFSIFFQALDLARVLKTDKEVCIYVYMFFFSKKIILFSTMFFSRPLSVLKTDKEVTSFSSTNYYH